MHEQAAMPEPSAEPSTAEPSPAGAARPPRRSVVLGAAHRVARAVPIHTRTAGVWIGRRIWDSLREGMVETDRLHPGVRRLVILGYVLILALFAILLAVDAFRNAPWMTELRYQLLGTSDPGHLVRMPVLAL